MYLCIKINIHLHLLFLQTLLSKATYNWGIQKSIHLEEANRPSLRHCSNKHKLAREGEKDKEKVLSIFFFFRMKSSSVDRVFSCCLKIDRDPADRGGKIIPPTRNGERECSGE